MTASPSPASLTGSFGGFVKRRAHNPSVTDIHTPDITCCIFFPLMVASPEELPSGSSFLTKIQSSL